MTDVPARTVAGLLRRVFVAVIATLLVVAAAGVAALFMCRVSLDDARALTELTYQVEDLRTAQARASAALRGWALLRDDATLTDFITTRDAVDTRLRSAADEASQVAMDGLFDGVDQAWLGWRDEATAVTSHPPEDTRASMASIIARSQTVAVALDSVRTSLDEKRVAARADFGRLLTRAFILTPLLALLGAVWIGFMVRQVNRQITKPLTRLGTLVRRESRGQPNLAANTSSGPREVRDVAKAFNDLTERQAELLQESERALSLQRTTSAVAQIVGAAGGEHIDWNMACRVLGRALGADGVTVHTKSPNDLTLAGFWVESEFASDYMLTNDDVRERILKDAITSGEEIIQFTGADSLHDGRHAVATLFAPVIVGRDPAGVVSVWSRGGRKWTTAEVSSCKRFADLAGRTFAEHQFVDTLLEVDRQKSEFVATTSHELRTPLTSIAGYLEMLEDGDFGPLSDAQRNAAEVVERNVKRLQRLIEDLLALNRMDLGRGIGIEETLDLPYKVTRVSENLTPLAREAGVTLVVDAVGDTKVRGDRDQIERALTNVIANGIKFTPSGGTVTVTTAELGRSVTVTVTDTGVGIPAAELSSVFTRFFRASNVVATTVPGTGLGLAISRGIVESHGGQIKISSVEGRGTTVQLIFPMAQPKV